MSTEKSSNSLDLNGPNFDANLYLDKLFKEASLKQILDHENEVVRDIQTLHSDMQTLVYENYNKFISATDTIKKMKNDFKKMETEMDSLMANMSTITTSAESINTNLKGTRSQISRLSSVHTLLQRLQFLFKLPANLKECMDQRQYADAVQNYQQARRVLNQYGELPSFKGIREDCQKIVCELRAKLRVQFHSAESSAQELADSVELLLRLGEPAQTLCAQFLANAEQRLNEQLVLLKDQSEQRDMTEFVDLGATGFLSDLCLVVVSFHDMFINRRIDDGDHEIDEEGNSVRNVVIFEQFAAKEMKSFIEENMSKYFQLVHSKIDSTEQFVETTRDLVQALNRFYKRVATNSLCEGVDFTMIAIEIITKAARKQCKHHLQMLKQMFANALNKIKQQLVTPHSQLLLLSPNTEFVDSISANIYGEQRTTQLHELLTNLIENVVEQIKEVLVDLIAFLGADIVFASKPLFVDSYCVDSVREGLIVCFLHHLTATARTFAAETQHFDYNNTSSSSGCGGGTELQVTVDGSQQMMAPQTIPPTLLLILSKFCVEFRNSHIGYVLQQTDKIYRINNGRTVTQCAPSYLAITTESEIADTMQESAQALLNSYVQRQAFNVSQMLRKSVETRDWLHTIEPRTVRAVMKRVIEDISTIDATVAQLYEEQIGSETGGAGVEQHSSDSSRKAHSCSMLFRMNPHRSWSNYSSYNLDSTLFSNVHKLFSEKIDCFASVAFSKASILTGIIKISLKTFMECVRLKTFSKYGLQQIQVDTHYLQLYLWRFVVDENVVHFLLDEILGSAVHRCLEPALMEPSIVDIICERI